MRPDELTDRSTDRPSHPSIHPRERERKTNTTPRTAPVQNHDFFHALTGLPPTVLGELGLKWLELLETGLPVAALSCTVGSLRLDAPERAVLFEEYLPWAVRQHQRRRAAGAPSLMNVYYEEEFGTPLRELRDRLHLEAAPVVALPPSPP